MGGLPAPAAGGAGGALAGPGDPLASLFGGGASTGGAGFPGLGGGPGPSSPFGAGVNRTLLKDIGTSIQRLNKEKGYTFCMIEHDMDFISRLCDPVIVMAEGSVLFEGTSDEVKNNEKVIESYLGRGSKIKGEN